MASLGWSLRLESLAAGVCRLDYAVGVCSAGVCRLESVWLESGGWGLSAGVVRLESCGWSLRLEFLGAGVCWLDFVDVVRLVGVGRLLKLCRCGVCRFVCVGDVVGLCEW